MGIPSGAAEAASERRSRRKVDTGAAGADPNQPRDNRGAAADPEKPKIKSRSHENHTEDTGADLQKILEPQRILGNQKSNLRIMKKMQKILIYCMVLAALISDFYCS